MGGGRETSTDRDKEGRSHQVYIVWPSDLHRLGYCPRLLFFETHLPRRRGLGERLRLLLGRLYHAVLSLPLRLRGFRVEEPLEVRLGNVVLRGRSDALALRGGAVHVVERKSGRAPRRVAWPSDILQAAAYGFMALRLGMASDALLDIRYRDASYTYRLDSETVSAVLRAVDDVVEIKYWGIVGYPRRSRGRCSRCPYRALCESLDRELAPPEEGEVYEPGEWLARERLSPPSASGATQGAGGDDAYPSGEGSHRG